MLEGMNVARLNFSHQEHAEHKRRFDELVSLREELDLPIAAMLDTRGPEIRLHTIKDGKAKLKSGDMFTLYTDEIEGDSQKASITYKDLPKDIAAGTRILIDDGLIELKAVSFDSEKIVCSVTHGGVISSRKGVNVPGVKLSLPYMSEQDRADIIFGIKTGFDFIAASFVRSAKDIVEIRDIFNEHDCHHIKIIAKIENADGVSNIDQILHVADGIMVARGDMGVEIEYEKLPAIQKKLIQKAYGLGKIVITATQMLESMMTNPRPTRAETSDVANAIYDGTSVIMLSGETAAGLHPIESIKAMVQIANQTESEINYERRFKMRDIEEIPNVTNAISEATVTTAHNLKANGIITVTESGVTARMISKFRPGVPIIACSPDERVYRQMNMSWGVVPVLVDEKNDIDELFEHSVKRAAERGYVTNGDLIVITTGVPLGVSGTTNLLKVHIVGNTILTGVGATQEVACAPLCVCRDSADAFKRFSDGDILVIPQTDNSLLDIMKNAAGIITEQDGLNSHSAIVGLTLNKPVIVGAKNATKILKNGVVVHLDAAHGTVGSVD